ncbi:MAG: hypothetical protein F6K10_41255 [Moorea sp. SIO2B7]|nr:hypothetical protein [Moorena sp. SIO2B7]
MANTQLLLKLSKQISAKNLSSEADKISKLADIKRPKVRYSFLQASKSLAYQYLQKWNKAEIAIEESIEYIKISRGREITSEQLEVIIFAYLVKINFLQHTKKNKEARIHSNKVVYIIIKYAPTNNDFLAKILIPISQEYLLIQLDYLMKQEKWQEADKKAWELILFIANQE